MLGRWRTQRISRWLWISVKCAQAVNFLLTKHPQRLLLKNPYVPLIFRLTVLAFSIAALAIAAAIYIQVNHVNSDEIANNQCATRASTFMGLSVGSVAVPYIAYVTWDEYMSKP